MSHTLQMSVNHHPHHHQQQHRPDLQSAFTSYWPSRSGRSSNQQQQSGRRPTCEQRRMSFIERDCDISEVFIIDDYEFMKTMNDFQLCNKQGARKAKIRLFKTSSGETDTEYLDSLNFTCGQVSWLYVNEAITLTCGVVEWSRSWQSGLGATAETQTVNIQTIYELKWKFISINRF